MYENQPPEMIKRIRSSLEVLGLTMGTAPAEIRSQYFMLLRGLHPDKQPHGRIQPEAEKEKLRQVRAAYAWLHESFDTDEPTGGESHQPESIDGEYIEYL